MDSVQSRDLAHIFGDLSQSKKHCEIELPLKDKENVKSLDIEALKP